MNSLTRHLGLLLCLVLFCPLAAAVQGSGIGSLPGAVDAADGKTVKPGEKHTNKDGVGVTNDATSKGNAKITPENGTGNGDDTTTVTTKSGFIGSVAGINSRSTVNLGAKNDCNVSGTGGTVNATGSSKGTITNTAPAGGGNIFVYIPSGGCVTVAPGTSYTL